MSIPSLALLLTGCTPQDAEITADYAVFLGADSSENLTNMRRKGTDIAASAGKLGLTPIDCRDLSYLDDPDLEAAERLDDVDYEAECDLPEPGYFNWIDDYAYYLKEEKVDAWRTEAVLTTEGDLQLTVHMDIDGFGDFRFGWVIDPDFQPTECVDGEDGAELVDVDGDWLTNWSADEDGTLWHLNAGDYQINPSNYDEYWYFEQDWMAGTAFARFGDEEFYNNAIDYNDLEGRPYYQGSYTGGDGSEIPGSPGFGLTDNESASLMDDWAAEVDAYFNGGDGVEPLSDLTGMGKSTFPYKMKIENNSWRPLDGDSSGLDGWLGVSPSWVRIDNKDDIQAKNDKPITGEFQIYLAGLSASSKLFVGGTFKIDNIREDVWGYSRGTLEEVKAEENETPTCGN